MLGKLVTLFNKLKADNVETEEASELSHLAATALLLELSKSDNNVDDVELNKILDIAKMKFKLSEQDASKLLEEAEQKNAESTSLYEFTEIINQSFDPAAKFELIKNMWTVAYADQTIDRYEDHLIRKVADLIYVSHSDFIRAKHIVADGV